MRVQARSVDYGECPEHLRPYVKADQVFVAVGNEYEVQAISVFRNVVFLQIVDEPSVVHRVIKDDLFYLGAPVQNVVDEPQYSVRWYPSWLFDIVDSTIPSDWIGNLFHGDLLLLVGPEFVASSEEAYSRMVEMEPTEAAMFWNRLDSRRES